MVDGTPQLATSFLESPVVSRGEYQYFIHPLTDGVPRVDPSLLSEVVDRMVELADMDCDVILAPEAMGIPLATALSIRTGIPFSVIRKRRYDLEGEIELHQRTGYSDSYLYINGVSAGDRVAIVDDVVSTGGTLEATIGALRSEGVQVTEVVVVFDKSDDLQSISEHLGVPIRSLLSIAVVDGVPTIR